MAEQMTEEQIAFQERMNMGTAWTRNEFFEKNGYLIIKNLCDPKELYCPVPNQKGQFMYGKKVDQFDYFPVESQVEGSVSRYWYPQYRQIHSQIRIKLEQELGRKLYNTYYYDRYYFCGQDLKKHVDRDSCEISVTVHVSTNLEGKDADWPICLKTPDVYTDKSKTQILVPGENRCITLQSGDGMLYKGCERPHWRDPMPSPKNNKIKFFNKNQQKEYYYHQIFFHYVLSDGQRAHHAWDRSV